MTFIPNADFSGNTGLPDSGERRQFETGAVRDMAVKGRCDLLPWDILENILPSPTGLCPSFCNSMAMATHHDYLTESIQDALDAFIAMAFGGSSETAILEVAFLYQKGARKYGGHNGRNWELGIPVDSFLDSAGRHFLKYLRGDHDERHDWAVVWNLLGALWTVKHHPEMIDAAVEGVT